MFYGKFYIENIIESKNIKNKQFFIILIIFVLSIIILVFSNSWIPIILGWDGLGVISFLLVIYYPNKNRIISGIVTVIINRLGDSFFISRFIFLIIWQSISLNYYLINSYRYIFILLLIIGCITKSAQFPFSSWLPAAIAAPTPVSSLVHSSTLVTAGIYLIIRFNRLINPLIKIILIVSLITMFLGGVCALYEKDFKKIIAISTLSQLGFILFCLSINLWKITLLHLLFHAFFKRTLFIATGSLIRLNSRDQESRKIRNIRISRYSKIIFIIRTINLMGFPFFIGFYRKDTVLRLSLRNRKIYLTIIVILIRCCITIMYRIRLIKLININFLLNSRNISFNKNYFIIIRSLVIYFLSIYSSNIFFINFLNPSFFNIIESIIGLLLILSSLAWNERINNKKKFLTIMIIIYYIIIINRILSIYTAYLNKKFKGVNYKEITWLEVVSSKIYWYSMYKILILTTKVLINNKIYFILAMIIILSFNIF